MKICLPILCISLLLTGCQNAQENDPGKNDRWKGNWERIEWQNGAELEISKISGDTITFYLFASHGASVAELNGFALINGNKATYLVNEEDAPADCSVTFELKGDSLITITEGASECGNLMYVWYKGDYYNSKLPSTKAKIEKGELLSTIGELDTIQDTEMRVLTGKDYKLFVNTTHEIKVRADEELNAQAYISWVQGLDMEMTNIIVIDKNNKIWAAVMDLESEKIFYYTNHPDYKTKLPNAIKEWKSRFDEYPVIYKSAK